jgi:DNA-directed RNA polymerase subunit F
MIIERKCLSMPEAEKYVDKEACSEIVGFMKKFVKIDSKKAEELRKKLEELDLIKLREEHIAKILELVPDNKEDLSKIFTDVSLEEEEYAKILETIKGTK